MFPPTSSHNWQKKASPPCGKRAGRIADLELVPLNIQETGEAQTDTLWLRGGFPESLTSPSDARSLRRFWTMLTHHQGGLLNVATLARNMGVDAKTAQSCIDLLCELLLVRRLPQWHANLGKRLVKTPKVYVRDSGLVHGLLDIATKDQLLSHMAASASWEGFVIENLLSCAPQMVQAHFYRSSSGAEIALLLTWPKGTMWAIELKRSLSPKVERGFHAACADLLPTRKLVVYPRSESFPLGNDVLAAHCMRCVRSGLGWHGLTAMRHLRQPTVKLQYSAATNHKFKELVTKMNNALLSGGMDDYELPPFLKRIGPASEPVKKWYQGLEPNSKMIFDPMTNALYGSDGRLIKTLNCPIALRFSDLEQLSCDSPDRFCHVCKETVVGINDLSDTEVWEKVAANPDICLFATSDAKNVIFLKPIGVGGLNKDRLPVIKTARSLESMDDAQKRGYRLLFRETGVDNVFGTTKVILYQNNATGKLWWSGDYRCTRPDPSTHNGSWRLVKDFFFIRPDRPLPIAAYLIPPDVTAGTKVYLEDVIEDRTLVLWNQGNAQRRVSETAIWDGADFAFTEESDGPALAQG